MGDDSSAGTVASAPARDVLRERWSTMHPTLLRQAGRILRDPDDAEEAVSRAVLAVLERDDRNPVAHLDAYLGAAVRNAAIDVLRVRSRSTSIDRIDDTLLVDLAAEADLTNLDDREALDPLRTALRRIPSSQRMALVATVVDERPTREVAKHLQRSPNATAALTLRARRALRAELTVALLERGGPACARYARAAGAIAARHDRTCAHCSEIRAARGTGRWVLAGVPFAILGLLTRPAASAQAAQIAGGAALGSKAVGTAALGTATVGWQAAGIGLVGATVVVASIVLPGTHEPLIQAESAGPIHGPVAAMPETEADPTLSSEPSPSEAAEPEPSASATPEATDAPAEPAPVDEPVESAAPPSTAPVSPSQSPADSPSPTPTSTSSALVPSTSTWSADGSTLVITLSGAATGGAYAISTEGVAGTVSGDGCATEAQGATCIASSGTLRIQFTTADGGCAPGQATVRIVPQQSGSNPVTVRSTPNCGA